MHEIEIDYEDVWENIEDSVSSAIRADAWDVVKDNVEDVVRRVVRNELRAICNYAMNEGV
jgi:hypothetical protein